MTIAEWDTINKYFEIDDLCLLRDLVYNNAQFEDTDQTRDYYGTVLDKLNKIISEVIPS